MNKVCFIVNPVSGGKDKGPVIASIERHLDPSLYRHTVLFTTRQGEAEEMARDADADVVVAVGGDGTVSEVARGLLGTDKTFGIIPCGSGDGLALHLGISRLPFRAVQMLNKGHKVLMDVGFIEGRPFFCTAGFGLDANVSLKFAASTERGLKNYIALAWEDWKHKPVREYRITSPSGELIWEGDAVFVTVANCNQWGNRARIAPMASLTDGLLDIVVVQPFSTAEIPVMATLLMTGEAAQSHHFLHFSGREFTVSRKDPGAYHFDGDPYKGGRNFHFSVKPAALRVIAPQRPA